MAAPVHAIYFPVPLEQAHIADILKEIYMDKTYDPILAGRKDLTILDIGGNIGLTSYYFSPYAKQVYTLEPDPFHVEIMEMMFEINNITNVKLIPAAIANEVTVKDFHFSRNTTASSLSASVDDGSQPAIKVPTVTIESLLKAEKIEQVDLMKLDCEGEEFNVLCGDAFHRVAPQIKALVVELHSWANRNYAQIPTTLTDLGYRVRQIPAQATIFLAERP